MSVTQMNSLNDFRHHVWLVCNPLCAFSISQMLFWPSGQGRKKAENGQKKVEKAAFKEGRKAELKEAFLREGKQPLKPRFFSSLAKALKTVTSLNQEAGLLKICFFLSDNSIWAP